MTYAPELTGLLANQSQFRRYDDKPIDPLQLSTADLDADRRAQELLNAKYAPVYKGIEERAARTPDPMDELLAARKRDLAYERSLPATTADMNDLDVTVPITRGEALPEQLKRGGEDFQLKRDLMRYDAQVKAAQAAHPINPETAAKAEMSKEQLETYREYQAKRAQWSQQRQALVQSGQWTPDDEDNFQKRMSGAAKDYGIAMDTLAKRGVSGAVPRLYP